MNTILRHCPGCNLTVFPYDPDKVTYKNQVWHGPCILKLIKASEPLQIEAVIPQQTPINRKS